MRRIIAVGHVRDRLNRTNLRMKIEKKMKIITQKNDVASVVIFRNEKGLFELKTTVILIFVTEG